MKAYLTRSFQRNAKGCGVSDEDCKEAIRRAENGLIDADLGARLIKQRIPRAGQGAARGLRAIMFHRPGVVTVCLHLFPKSGKSNLTRTELAEYQKFARSLEKLTEPNLRELSATNGWKEVEL
jgi:hypothetical protein